jgi:hypothetical protein
MYRDVENTADLRHCSNWKVLRALGIILAIRLGTPVQEAVWEETPLRGVA